MGRGVYGQSGAHAECSRFLCHSEAHIASVMEGDSPTRGIHARGATRRTADPLRSYGAAI